MYIETLMPLIRKLTERSLNYAILQILNRLSDELYLYLHKPEYEFENGRDTCLHSPDKVTRQVRCDVYCAVQGLALAGRLLLEVGDTVQ